MIQFLFDRDRNEAVGRADVHAGEDREREIVTSELSSLLERDLQH